MSNPWQIQTIQYDNTSAEGNIDATGYGQISILLSKYVLKEKGKGLSSNDFTDNDVRKLDSIEVGAQVNKLETLSINGGEKLHPDSEKNINFFVPTKVSQVENDSGYARLINTSQIEGYEDSYVGKSKYAFQDVENPAIGKNANADAGGVALGMNTSTSEVYDVNINNELKHNVETEMWEGKITESETSDYAIKNLNDTDLTELDTVIANLAIEVQDRIDGDNTLTQLLNAETTARQNADTILRNDLTLETQNRTTADTTLQNNINTEVQNRTNADSTLQGNINAEIQNRTNADNTLQSSINTEIQNRTNADNALQNSINTEIQNRTDDTTALQNSITSNTNKISTIESKIPNQASSTNQLADKSFVNSTVQTNTANFRGNWDTWTQVPTEASSYPSDYAGNTTPTVNDYMVVQNASDYSLETLHGTWRFKYTSNWTTEGKNGWIPEYQVNEEPFTSEQLYAINSGITSDKVTCYDSHVTNTNNPHSVTKAQVGLENVCNVGTINSVCQGSLCNVTSGAVYDALSDVGTVSMCDISENADVPVILCADTCSIGKSVTCSFTFNPSSGVVCATCFNGTVTQVKVGTTAYDPTNGVVSLPAYPSVPTVPTKVSDLTNDSGFTTCTGTVTSITVCCNGTSLGTANATTPSKTFNIYDRQVQHIQLCSSADRKILFASGDITCNACCCVYYSDGTNGCPFTYNANNGELKTPKVTIGKGCATMQYNSTTQAIEFVFA